jgi:hypothetical protein
MISKWRPDRPDPIERLTWLKSRIKFDAVIDVGSQDHTGFITNVFPELPTFKYDKDPQFQKHAIIVELGVNCSLDDLLQNETFESAFYKLDVDGPELDILNVSTNTLQRTSAIMIECVLDGNRFLDRCQWMHEHNWRLIDVIEPVYRKSNMLIQVDLVFVKEELFKRIERECYIEAPDN